MSKVTSLLKVHLRLWEEVIGICRAIDRNESVLSITIDGFQLTFRTGSSEALMLEKVSIEGFLGKKVGILRTDSPEEPLRVRLISEK